MKTIGAVRALAVGLAAWSLSSPLPAQEKKDVAVPGKMVERKGEAPFNVHVVKLEKGTTYRITVKADGFEPVMTIRAQFVLNSAEGVDREARMLFTAPETREYQILVNFAPRGTIEKGDRPYTLLVERAEFSVESKLQEPLKLDTETFTLEAGKAYLVTVKSTDFAPNVCVVDGTKSVAQGAFRGPYSLPRPGAKNEMATTLSFVPGHAGEYRVLVAPAPYQQQQATRNYTVTLAELKTELTVAAELTADDPIFPGRQGRHKVHESRLTAGRTYQIDMRSTAFDSYLVLTDSTGNVLASNDDFGEGLNSRIVYRPTRTDTYRIVATTFGSGRTGAYTVTVVDDPSAAQPFSPVRKAEATPEKAVEIKPIILKAEKGDVAEYQGELTNADARYQRKLAKVFAFPMEAEKSYRIDLLSGMFDAYLFLEDPAGRVVNQNDDNGQSLDSRIVHRAEKAGVYRIIATSLDGNSTGELKLTVRLATEAEARLTTLQKRVPQLFQADPRERDDVIAAVAGYLEGRGAAINQGDLGLAFMVSQALRLQKDNKAAGDACLRLADSLAKSDEAGVAAAARLLRGVAKQLTLVGNEMQVKGKTLEGKDFDLGELKGKVVLVDFWATWCGPCIAEVPHIQAMHTKYHRAGFEVIGVSLDRSVEPIKEFIAKKGVPWPTIWNGVGKDSVGLAEQYGVMAIPLAILVGRDGRVVSLNARGQELTRLLEQLIDEKKTSP